MSQAQRRLMDLLAGWSDYVQKCAANRSPGDPPPDVYQLEAEMIVSLYQEVGSVEDMHETEVRLLAMGTLTKLIVDGQYTPLGSRR